MQVADLVAAKSEHQAKELRAQYKRYETWAVEMLESAPDKNTAMGMLAVVPLVDVGEGGFAQPNYLASVLDLAAEDDGEVAYPCKKVVAHRHAQDLLDRYWNGKVPGSKAAVDEDTPMGAMLLQLCFFFVPGLFVNIERMSSKVVHRQARSGKGVVERFDEAADAVGNAIEEAVEDVADAIEDTVDGALRAGGIDRLSSAKSASQESTKPPPGSDELNQSPFPPTLEDLADLWQFEGRSRDRWSLGLIIHFFAIPRVRYMVVFFCSLGWLHEHGSHTQ